MANRQNGFTLLFVPLITGLKPGVNERGNYSSFEAKPACGFSVIEESFPGFGA
jgi:hypothetical protein